MDVFYAALQISFVSPLEAFGEFASQSLFAVLKSGFDFSAYTAAHGSANLILTILTTALAFCTVGSVKNINWDNLKIAIPAFLTLSVMPFTYNISYGIAFGLISYIVISVFCGDARKIKGSSWGIAALFIAMLLLAH